MFLQRNVASQTFVIPGTLRAIADGSAVTAGSLSLVLDNAAATTSTGTLTHISEGAFKYTPTQAETDCKILGYILSGTGAIAVCGSIRTTGADPNDAVRLGLTDIYTIDVVAGAYAGTTAGAALAGVHRSQTLGTASGTPSATSIPSTGAGLSSADNSYVNMWLEFTGGALAGQRRQISAYVGSSKTFTVDAFPTAPSESDTFAII